MLHHPDILDVYFFALLLRSQCCPPLLLYHMEQIWGWFSFFFFFLPIVVVIGTKVQTEVPVSAVNHSFLPKLLAPGQYLEKLNPKTFSQSR